ncbi:MAG: hypothetical protein DRH24_18860 [Deltaproteobacteria bacterium]|nr:MAG: hypothetical protein DRH24_18860 [Deltaproteobacteria bacterium]
MYQKNAFHKTPRLLFVFLLILAIFSFVALAYSADPEPRLVVKDASETTTFSVQDDGSVYSASKVGIGTDSPNYQFEVEGNSALQVLTRYFDTLASNAPGLLFQRAKGTQSSPANIEAGTYLGKLQFRGRVGSNYINYGYFALVADDTNQHGYYTFQDAGKNNRLIVETTGNVGIGTDDPEYLLQVQNAYCDGYTWENGSSREIKKNISDLTTDEANQALKKLSPVKFTYKADKENEEYVGFIAEDVPELVASRDRKGLGSMDIVAVLTKVVQQQQETIARLSEKMVEMEQKLKIKQMNLASNQ